ncbi:MAG: sulfotransferase [Myxococcota bacterium]|nr:sulfotransferase [Myxococcota bacterium]
MYSGTQNKAVDPGTPLLTRALETLGEGNRQGAMEYCRRGIQQAPDDSELHRVLGECLAQEGEISGGIASLERARELNPADVRVLESLGIVLAMARRFEEAATVFQVAVNGAPERPRLQFEWARALLGARRVDEAVSLLEQVCRRCPDFAAAHVQLGRVQLNRGRNLDAIAPLRRAATIQPNNVQVISLLGRAVAVRGNEAARACFERAVELAPEEPQLHVDLGHSRVQGGDLEGAEASYRKALGLAPGMVAAEVGLGHVLHRQGENDEALVKVMDVATLEHPPGDSCPLPVVVANALTVYALALRSLGRAQEAVPHLERWLARGPYAQRPEVMVWHTLGGLYEKLGDPERALAAHQRANESKRCSYDPAAQDSCVAGMVAAYPAPIRPLTPPLDGPRPVFIVGMPRSGTSLLEQILACHPEVHGAGELSHVRRITEDLPRRLRASLPYPECRAVLDRHTATDLARSHLSELSELAGDKLIVIDKMNFNFLYLGIINELFPGARILHCTRSPLDTCLSCYCQNFNSNLAFSNRLDHLAHYHRSYQRLMEHWSRVITLPMREVVYEDLVEDLEGTVSTVLDFLDLPWDDRCLRFHQSDRTIATASFEQVRRPLYTSSVGRSDRYRHLLGPLVRGLGQDGH